MTEMITTPAYFFNAVPPAVSRVYFSQPTVYEMLLFGGLVCPYGPPQRTVFPGGDQVGRWTLHYDDEKTKTLRDIATGPYASLHPRLIATLPGMLLRYEDFAAGETLVWRLTDDVLLRDNANNLQLGVWPD